MRMWMFTKLCVTLALRDLWGLRMTQREVRTFRKRMGAFLDKPKMEKHNAHGEGNSLRFGLSSMQGWRVEMEDAHTAVIGLPNGLQPWSFFAVYDGHAGSQVARYCCEHLLDHITNNPDFWGVGWGSMGSVAVTPTGGSGSKRGSMVEETSERSESRSSSVTSLSVEPSVENVKKGIRTGFLQIDEHMRALSERKHGADRSGSTAVGVMISPRHIYFINCGDSRALLSRGGRVHFFTQDHKPSNPAEKERIQNAGGSVMIQRVNGSLAVSRALGDFDYKCVHGKGPTEQLVSPEPEVYEIERSESEDEFVVLACDGIWDVMANEELCDFVRSRLELTDDLESVCNEIVDTCLYKGSRDNMSVVLVCFPGAPKISPEAVKREEELDKHLHNRVEELAKLQQQGAEGMPGLVHVMRTLATEDIPNLPPGGGLASKHSLVEAAYSNLKPHKNDSNVSAISLAHCLLHCREREKEQGGEERAREVRREREEEQGGEERAKEQGGEERVREVKTQRERRSEEEKREQGR
ncbi:protein phosphatase, Mg2+/Mn2+ dependent, 1Ab isoform X2 [Engraulis encrasicolus]|uniref:protein phosphatase, Mg2+/Mn2+ dependent, 1Ab isoform X2 n=1 Tax=Engraulis encrasicolus TaxID=184585 RepID=UPI002FD45E24